LKDDFEGSVQLCSLWLRACDGFDCSTLPEPSRVSAEAVTKFAVAFCAVAAATPFTQKGFETYMAVFVGMGPRKTMSEFHKLLVIQCRKNTAFRAIESTVGPAAASELHEGRAVLDMLEQLAGPHDMSVLSQAIDKMTGPWKDMHQIVLQPLRILVAGSLKSFMTPSLEIAPEAEDTGEKVAVVKAAIAACVKLHGEECGTELAAALMQARKFVDTMRASTSLASITKILAVEDSDSQREALFRMTEILELDSLGPTISPEFGKALGSFASVIVGHMAALAKTVLHDQVWE
jgi:hypothetical protein